MHGYDISFWQPEPSYPTLHVHVHDPVVPPTVPPLMQKSSPSDPSLLESKDAMHVLAVWQFAPSYPSLQDVQVHEFVVPPMIPPLIQ